MENELQVIVEKAGLDKTKAGFVLEKFQGYFKVAAEWEKRAKEICVTDDSQKEIMSLARTGRLFLRDKRIAIEKSRKELKEQALREGKAIDGIANVLKALIQPIESYLENQEHFVENKLKAEAEEARIEAEKKAEEDRIIAEQKMELEKERRFQTSRLYDFIPDYETIIFADLTGDEYADMVDIAKQKREDYEKEQERIRIENEKLKKEAEKKELQRIENEKKQKEKELKLKFKAEQKQKAIEEKAEKEKALLMQKEKKAQAEKERLENELKSMIECPFCHKKFQLKK